jgi:two-component system, sensor histidine kinase and response regulator
MTRRILVVEDHHDTSFTLCRLLKLEGYEVEHAIDGVAGFSTATSRHPDLIVTDLQMPRMNGIEMIRRIREDFDLNNTPILVMSAYGRRTLDEAMEAGANGFIEKPLDFDSLLAKVRETLLVA